MPGGHIVGKGAEWQEWWQSAGGMEAALGREDLESEVRKVKQSMSDSVPRRSNLFIQKTFLEHLFCVQHCSRHWLLERTRTFSLSHSKGRNRQQGNKQAAHRPGAGVEGRGNGGKSPELRSK